MRTMRQLVIAASTQDPDAALMRILRSVFSVVALGAFIVVASACYFAPHAQGAEAVWPTKAGAALADDLRTVGDPESLGFSARRLERMTSWFEAQTKKGDPSGFVVAIARGGKLAYLQPTGFEDHDRQVP